MIGQTISHYTITAKLGEGGMGEVYLATDTNLDRKVAIKFLSADRAADPDARQRFLHEAKAQAMLSHANIATFLDVGESDGHAFLVMEYVEGKPLTQIAKDEKQSLPEILDLVIQVAEGLQAAHEHGIVHRDVKPENILVTAKRQVKITDFGLAKWKGATTLTKDGTRMGTAYYMSPEQAEGKRVDHRSDIFSLGVILYELVCRRRPFEGETETAIVYAVVSEIPQPLARYCVDVPEELQRVVGKCLAKIPEERYQSVADLVADLMVLRGALGGTGGTAFSKPSAAKRSWKLALMVVTGMAVVAAVTALVTRHFLPVGGKELIVSYILPPVNSESCFQDGFALSPDGRNLAFVSLSSKGERLVWVRSLDRQDAMPIAGTDDASYPFWSLDSKQIAFYSGGKLKRVAASGGPVRAICAASLVGNYGNSWGSAGIILFSDVFGSISSVSENGGEPTRVLTEGAFPFFLPDGQRFLYVNWNGGKSGAYVASVDKPDPGKEVVGTSDADRVEWASPNHLLLHSSQERTLIAQRVDLGSASTQGRPTLLAERVTLPCGCASFSVSQTNVLAFVSKPPEARNDYPSRLTWVDRNGNVLGYLGDIGGYWYARISADGRRVAVNPDDDIWLSDISTGLPTRFTNEMASGFFAHLPLWSPQSDRIVAHRWSGPRYEIWEFPISGSQPREILRDSTTFTMATDWSRDGRYLAITRNVGNAADLAYFDSVTNQLESFLATPSYECDGQFSPDGRWMAYASNETGTFQIYVRSFPDGEKVRRLSYAGGTHPRWRGDGRELFFLAPGWTVMAADVRLQPTLEVGTPSQLFQMVMADICKGTLSPYDVSPDGQRFLVISPTTKPGPLTLVQNWAALVDR